MAGWLKVQYGGGVPARTPMLKSRSVKRYECRGMITYLVSKVFLPTYRQKWMRMNAIGFYNLEMPFWPPNNGLAHHMGFEIHGLMLWACNLPLCGFRVGLRPFFHIGSKWGPVDFILDWALVNEPRYRPWVLVQNSAPNSITRLRLRVSSFIMFLHLQLGPQRMDKCLGTWISTSRDAFFTFLTWGPS